MEGLSFLSDLRFEPPAVYEYLLVVNPDSEVYNQLIEEEEKFSADYKVRIAEKTLPHITVGSFMAKESMEETLIKWMHNVISNQQSFKVMLNNFSGFPSSRTVYARVQDHEPFKQLAASLKVINDYINNNGFPSANIIHHPHITIAKKLAGNIYDKAIMDYSRKTFNVSFMVDELVLLKRSNRFDKCKPVSVFKLAAPAFEAA